jgi:alpha-galactosidase/6-phospho-beta-glucosidase family protein
VRAEQQELTVEAALPGDRRVALQALAADPLIGSLEQAAAIQEDPLREQRDWLHKFDCGAQAMRLVLHSVS